jgi:hypothetical protein
MIPVLLLTVLSLLYLGHRLGWPPNRWARRLAGGAWLAAVASSLPWQGVDFAVVKRVDLLIAAAYALMLFEDREALVFIYRGLLLAWLELDRRRSGLCRSANPEIAIASPCTENERSHRQS